MCTSKLLCVVLQHILNIVSCAFTTAVSIYPSSWCTTNIMRWALGRHALDRWACSGPQVYLPCSHALRAVLRPRQVGSPSNFPQARITFSWLPPLLHRSATHTYSAYGKYSQRFTFSTLCYITALFQNWFNSFFLRILHTIPHNDKVKKVCFIFFYRFAKIKNRNITCT